MSEPVPEGAAVEGGGRLKGFLLFILSQVVSPCSLVSGSTPVVLLCGSVFYRVLSGCVSYVLIF